MGIRTWHRGMSFRFILFLWRHHQDFMNWGKGIRIRTWHRGMSFRFILHLRKLKQDFKNGAGHEAQDVAPGHVV